MSHITCLPCITTVLSGPLLLYKLGSLSRLHWWKKWTTISLLHWFATEFTFCISTDIPEAEFEDKWNKISQALVALGLDQQEIDRLKEDPIDHDTKRRVDEEVGKWKLDFEPRVQNLEQEVQQLKLHIQDPKSVHTAPCELSSCLPDEVQDVFGRSKEIQQVVKAVQSGTVSIAVITGGPGFGKTTVANKVAHKLAKSEDCRSVLCCSLASKTDKIERSSHDNDPYLQ